MSKLMVLDPHAAGIDVGSERMHVSVAGGPPEVFGSTTIQLLKLRDWLRHHQVRSVAVEATGIYWLCLYEVLEEAGIRVLVVNGRHVRNLPGRKTDMSDCQWLATLHSHGLLRSGFVPAAHIRRLQDYVRLRQDHVAQAASHVLHMHKALERMNLKPHNVISSLTGTSGLRMIRSIVAGQRDPKHLVQLCDGQIRIKKTDRLLEALTGTWKEEHLFALRQALQAWDFCQRQIQECDVAIEMELRAAAQVDDISDGTASGGDVQSKATMRAAGNEPTKESIKSGVSQQSKTIAKAKKAGPNTPKIADLHGMLTIICGGKDVTAIPGIADQTLLQLISEVGTDLSAWPTDKHFTSWLGLAPGSRQSGKRRGSAKLQVNRAGRLFCTVAMSVGRSVDKGLGGFYRRLKARRGAPVANKALARKIAMLFWQAMVHGLEFVEEGLAQYHAKTAATQLRVLQKMARQQGWALVQKAPLRREVIG